MILSSASVCKFGIGYTRYLLSHQWLAFNIELLYYYLIRYSESNTTISYLTKLTYAAPAWWGYTDACSRLRLQAVINRLRRFGLLPLNSLHMRNSVSTCVGNYSGGCSTTSSTSCTNFFPRRKRHHMRYALVPIAGSSPGLTINFAAISLFACFTNLKFSVFLLTSMILSHLCQTYYCYLICIWTVYFYVFLCYSFASVKRFNKEFTYLIQSLSGRKREN